MNISWFTEDFIEFWIYRSPKLLISDGISGSFINLNKLMFRMFKKYLSLLVVFVVVFISGCGKNLSGVYEQVPGDKGMVDVGLSIEFVSGEKAYMSVMGVKTEVKYSIDGKNLKIENAGVNQIMTIQDDGSILYPLPMVGSVVLKKK